MVGFIIGTVFLAFGIGILLGIYLALLSNSSGYSGIPSPLKTKKETNGKPSEELETRI
jgi:hypothetical protein